jgi:adenylate cyclase
MLDAMRLNPFPPTWYSARVAVAFFTLKRYVDAVQAFKRIPESGYWMRARLAACYAHLGNQAEARAQVEAILRLRPTFSIDQFMKADVLLERPEDRDHLREGLTKAGLPVVQETQTL